MKDPTDGLPGLRLETAASIIAREFVTDHLSRFSLAIRRDRIASQAVAATFLDALSGTLALAVTGGQGSREELYAVCCKQLLEKIDRDLRHLGAKKS